MPDRELTWDDLAHFAPEQVWQLVHGEVLKEKRYITLHLSECDPCRQWVEEVKRRVQGGEQLNLGIIEEIGNAFLEY